MKIFILRNRRNDYTLIEYIRNWMYYFEKRGYTFAFRSNDTSETLEHESPSIVFWFPALAENNSKLAPISVYPQHTYVLLNVEQMTRPEFLFLTRQCLERYPAMKYADYSTANMELLNPDRPSAWLPFLYAPHYPVTHKERTTPLLFYGCMNDERRDICRKLGATVIQKYGKERDEYITQAKCVLNCHFRDTYRVLETVRIHHAIFLGTPVYVYDTSLPEKTCLSPTAQTYILRSPDVPDLPPIDPVEEIAIGEQIIDDFISRLSLPKPTVPSDDALLPN